MSGTSDTGEPCEIKAPVIRARHRVDQNSREFNISLWRIATGACPGGVAIELSRLTGFSPDSIRSRVAEAGKYPEVDPLPAGCNATIDDQSYRAAIQHDLRAPETRQFLQGIAGSGRRRPDAEDPRVARQRIRTADGGSKLISIAIDLSRS